MGKAHIKAKKREIDGHLFDSADEADYYEYLKSRDDVENIELQPQFTFMPPFTVNCGRCRGEGQKPSPKTGNMIQCQRCKGSGKAQKKAWTYSADFRVTYQDGHEEVIDIKGGWKNERFNLVRKMYEYQFGEELVVIQKKRGEWVRV